MLYSFDIFNTLITRVTATPKGIFSMIQDVILKDSAYSNLPNNLRSNFYEMRVEAEEYSRKNISSGEEITIDSIYTVIGLNNALSKSQVKSLIDLEFKMEIENIVPITENMELIKSLLNSGEKVVLISDIYLPIEFIQKMMLSIDIIFKNVPIYLSSEINLTKSSGNLYKYISEHESVEFCNWKHIGDNVWSDVEVPKLLGINAKLFQYSDFMPYEKKLLNCNESNLTFQISIGSARNMRLLNKLTGMSLTGISLGGVLLYSYVSWVLEQSISLGVNNLYFIARDGFVLKKIADSIISSKKLTIKTHYIYGSRRAWRIPSDKSKNDLSYVFRPSFIIKDINCLAKALGVSVDNLCSYLPNAYNNSKKYLSKGDLLKIQISLEQNDSFMKIIYDKNKQLSSIIRDYFNQEVINTNDSFAFVDLNGTGITMQYISDILEDTIDEKLKIFYLSMSNAGDNKLDSISKYYWSYNVDIPGDLLELFCRAPHGETIGYDKIDGVITPVFESGLESDKLSNDFDKYYNYTEFFAKKYSKLDTIWNLNYDSVKMFNEYMKYLKNPDSETLNTLASIPFSDTFNDSIKGREYAPRISIIKLILDYIRYGQLTITGNIEYSAKRSPRLFQLLLIWTNKILSYITIHL